MKIKFYFFKKYLNCEENDTEKLYKKKQLYIKSIYFRDYTLFLNVDDPYHYQSR